MLLRNLCVAVWAIEWSLVRQLTTDTNSPPNLSAHVTCCVIWHCDHDGVVWVSVATQVVSVVTSLNHQEHHCTPYTST